MAGASKTLPPEEQLYAPKEARLLMTAGALVGAVGLGVAVAMGVSYNDNLTKFLFSYQVAFCYFLAIALGGLFFVTLQHLTRAGWSVVVRRLAEVVASTLPVMFLLFLPVLITALMGNYSLFEWMNPELVEKDQLVQHKVGYLNPTFFTIRALVFFLFWSAAALYFFRNSVKQDQSGDPTLTSKAEARSAPAMIFFALTLTFAAVDWIMSLVPHWYSTIIGVYYFAGSTMSIMAVLILLSRFFQARGKLQGVVTTEHYHDLGKLLFAFVFFWGYIAFSQFMLLWYANIPEGTMWYLARQQGQWVYFSFALLFIHLLIPWVGLVSRHAKRRKGILMFWVIWLLFAHWMDMVYLILPTPGMHGHGDPNVIPLGLLDVACFLGVGGIFVAAIGFGLRNKALIPLKDPRLSESLGFENF